MVKPELRGPRRTEVPQLVSGNQESRGLCEFAAAMLRTGDIVSGSSAPNILAPGGHWALKSSLTRDRIFPIQGGDCPAGHHCPGPNRRHPGGDVAAPSPNRSPWSRNARALLSQDSLLICLSLSFHICEMGIKVLVLPASWAAGGLQTTAEKVRGSHGGYVCACQWVAPSPAPG